MEGENNGKPYFLMDDLGEFSHYFRVKKSFEITPESYRGFQPSGMVGQHFVPRLGLAPLKDFSGLWPHLVRLGRFRGEMWSKDLGKW